MRLPEKRWHFVAVVSPDVFVATAIADVGYLGVAFAYAYERSRAAVRRYATIAITASAALTIAASAEITA